MLPQSSGDPVALTVPPRDLRNSLSLSPWAEATKPCCPSQPRPHPLTHGVSGCGSWQGGLDSRVPS